MSLGNISNVFTFNNVKKRGLKGVEKFVSVDFNPIDTNNILDIQRFFMKEHDKKKMFVVN